MILSRTLPLIAMCALAIGIASTEAKAAGSASEARQEYACGSLAGIPAMVAESASLRCADGSGKQTDIAAKGKDVLCIFATQCAPATPRVKRKILDFLKKDDWSKLSDDEVARAMADLNQAGSIGQIVPIPMQVHCVASRTKNGNPDCPGVNDCANDNTSSLIWSVTPIAMADSTKSSNINGLRIEKSETSAPERVESRKAGTAK